MSFEQVARLVGPDDQNLRRIGVGVEVPTLMLLSNACAIRSVVTSCLNAAR